VLDGGAIVFCLIEMIIRRPVPEKAQEWLMKIGAGLLIALMLFATFNDVMRWFK
jgi:regulator of sigma E protease